MRKLTAPSKSYNYDRLEDEFVDIPAIESLVLRNGTDLEIYVADETPQETDDLILGIASDHVPDLTDEQNAKLAREVLSEGATTSKKSWGLILTFNNSPEADVKTFIAGGGTLATLDRDLPTTLAYVAWRTYFDSLDEQTKVLLGWYMYMVAPTYDIEPEPIGLELTKDYKAWFVNGLSQVLGYLTDRALT